MNKFVVVVFSNDAKANDAGEIFRDLHRDGSLTLYGLAIARKSENGEVTVVEKQGEGLPRAGVGALAGALVGLLGGPLTAILGAAGGAWIGTWRDIEHLGVGSDFIEEVAKVLSPGGTAVVADVSEDRVADVDEQMALLGGVVLREWQSELPEMKLAAEAAARKIELEQLAAERRNATPQRQGVVKRNVERANARLDDTAKRAKAKLEGLEASTEARIRALNDQAATAGPNVKTSIEQRLSATRLQHDRRAALLRQTLEIVEEARASA